MLTPVCSVVAAPIGSIDHFLSAFGGSIAHFGKYTVAADGKTITFNIEASTFPNWDGTKFKRPWSFNSSQQPASAMT